MWAYRQTDELYHYGVKGMKWGVRRYQNKDGSLTSNGKKRYNQSDNKIDENKQKESTKKKGLSKKQKALIIGASVVATYAAYKFVDSGKAKQLVEKGKAALGKDTSFKKNLELSRKDLSEDEIVLKVVNRINPDYGKPGTTKNCKRCTYAYEMSRRGFDVKATKSVSSTGQNAFGTFNATNKEQTNTFKEIISALSGKSTNFDKQTDKNRASRRVIDKYTKDKLDKDIDIFKFEKAKKSASKIDSLHADIMGQTITKKSDNYTKDIFKAIAKHPNGARGELVINYRVKGSNIDLGGHSVAWEMVNNHPVIFDCQTGKKYNMASFEKDFGKLLYGASINRLDNKELNEDFLRRWLANA